MPPTGKELNVGDITQIDANIHAGVKYMRFMMDQYYKDDPMDPLNTAARRPAFAPSSRVSSHSSRCSDRGRDDVCFS